MKKCILLNVLVVLSFIFLNQDSVYSDDPGPGELIITTTPSTTKTIKVEAVGTVWGSKDEGYPITHEFDFWQNTSPSFFLEFVDNKPLNQTDNIIGYGKYKITIDGNSTYVDYRDCDYEGCQCGEYDQPGVTADIEVDYNVNTGTFTKSPSSGNIWDKLSNKPPDPSCFPIPPAAPQNLVLVNAGEFGANPQLSWDANSEPDLAGYHVWRGWQISQSPINWSQIATVTTTSYTDNDWVRRRRPGFI